MVTEDEVRELLRLCEADALTRRPPINISEDPLGALMQLQMDSRINTLKWVLTGKVED